MIKKSQNSSELIAVALTEFKPLLGNVSMMGVSSESPRVRPPDRVGDLPVFCVRGVGHLPFIFARG